MKQMIKASQAAALALALAAGNASAATVQWEGQSPIDIVTADAVKSPKTEKIEFHYQSEDIVLTNTYNPSSPIPQEWGTLKAKPVSGPAFASYVTINGEKYVLAQFHFHQLSEHSIDGVRAPMEVHFVHLRVHANGEPYCIGEPQSLLVIGALIDEGKTNKTLDEIFSLGNLPGSSTASNVTVEKFSMQKVLPGGASYRYHGSLTAPAGVNCTADVFGHATELYNEHNVYYNTEAAPKLSDHTLGEDGSFPEAVNWVVMQKHLTMNQDQIDAFVELFPEGNSRPVQDLKGRSVKLMK